MLKLEPGQEAALKAAQENDLVAMKVISSKGEDDEVPAPAAVRMPGRPMCPGSTRSRAAGRVLARHSPPSAVTVRCGSLPVTVHAAGRMMQRNPRWQVEVSIGWGIRAAGR